MPRKDRVVDSISTNQETKDMKKAIMDRGIVFTKAYESFVKAVYDGTLGLNEDGSIKLEPKVIEVEKVVEKVVEVPVEVETDCTEYDRKFHRFIEKLEEKGYPKSVIDRYLENMLDNVCEMGKYNAKRGRYEEAC